jgi:small subunit ribosomal protein S14
LTLSSTTRNNHCIKLEAKYREKRKELKAKVRMRRLNPEMDINEHMKNVFALHNLPRNSSRIRIRNRCSITGRGRGVFRYFGLCGMKIREMALKGLLPGVRHASW